MSKSNWEGLTLADMMWALGSSLELVVSSKVGSLYFSLGILTLDLPGLRR